MGFISGHKATEWQHSAGCESFLCPRYVWGLGKMCSVSCWSIPSPTFGWTYGSMPTVLPQSWGECSRHHAPFKQSPDYPPEKRADLYELIGSVLLFSLPFFPFPFAGFPSLLCGPSPLFVACDLLRVGGGAAPVSVTTEFPLRWRTLA